MASNRTLKSEFRKHKYSGPRKNRKQVRAALKWHYGLESREAVWRKVGKKQDDDLTENNLSPSEPRTRRVTNDQLKLLYEILKDNKEIAFGDNESAEEKAHASQMWQRVAHELNALGEGAIKNAQMWSRYWDYLKTKLRRSAATNSLNSTGGTSEVKPQSNVDELFSFIHEDKDYGAGSEQGVQADPLSEQPQEMAAEEESVPDHDLFPPSSVLNKLSEDPIKVEIDEVPCEKLELPKTRTTDTRDECKIFSELVENKLRNLSRRNRTLAQRRIFEVFCQLEMKDSDSETQNDDNT